MTARKIILTTDFTRPPLSPNARLHWATKARIVREARTQVMYRARGAGVPVGLSHVTVTVHYRPGDKRGLWDVDNLMAGCKPIFDALTARGKGAAHPVVEDDTPVFMSQCVVQHPPVKGLFAAVWITLEWDAADERVSA